VKKGNRFFFLFGSGDLFGCAWRGGEPSDAKGRPAADAVPDAFAVGPVSGTARLCWAGPARCRVTHRCDRHGGCGPAARLFGVHSLRSCPRCSSKFQALPLWNENFSIYIFSSYKFICRNRYIWYLYIILLFFHKLVKLKINRLFEKQDF